MHKTAKNHHRPLAAFNIQVFLEIVLLVLRVLDEVQRVLGISFNIGGGQD